MAKVISHAKALLFILRYISYVHCVINVYFIVTVSINGLRTEIKHYIDEADTRMIKVIHAMLEADRQDDWWDDISADERAGIVEGMLQMETHRGIPHEEVMKKYNKWLKK